MTNPIVNLLGAPLSPDWTVEGLAEQVLSAMAVARSEEGAEFVIDADASTDRQVRRLLRPVLACLANKSAAEAGKPVDLYGGSLNFKRPGLEGPVWIVGQFENRPGSVRVTLRRSTTPLAGQQYGTAPRQLAVEAPKIARDVAEFGPPRTQVG